MRCAIGPLCAAAIATLALLHDARGEGADLALIEKSDSFVVDTGAGLSFSVSRRNGDLTSLVSGGRECEAPFDKPKRYSHFASGLSRDSKITAEKDPAGAWIKITIDDTQIGVTHYYIARRGESNLYMATFAAKLPPPGEMRFITYLNRDVFTHVPPASDIASTDGVVEGKDVFRNSKAGATFSKFYGATPIIDGGVHGITGDGIGCFMDMGCRETASGGAFFRDIENQSTEAAAELYNYMYSGHTQTEPFRPGLKGPYALQFTDGHAPAAPDYSFIQKLGLQGYVPASARGALSGRVTGVRPGHRATVALANAAAQYWATPDAGGAFTMKDALPGSYTAMLYDTELAVATQRVTIEAGKTANADIAATLVIPTPIFRIGEWDGTPRGFLNADKITEHHPGDACMTPFAKGNFVVGQSKDADWPLAEWKGVNDEQRITFTLAAAEATTPLTLRIGITLAYNDGRPQIELNAGTARAWKSPLPPPSDQPRQSRGITRGTWRGNNDIFPFNLPPAALQLGANTIDIRVESGKASQGFLSPNIVFDAIDLVPTAEARKATATRPAN